MNEKPRTLFVAPINMKAGDVVIILFGKPALIKRDGVEIWQDKTLPEIMLPWLDDARDSDNILNDG